MVYITKKIICAIIIFFFPIRATYWILNMLGHSIHNTVKIGFSIIWVDKLDLKDYVKIHHFNIIIIRELNMAPQSFIKHFNIFKGNIICTMSLKSSFGKRNTVSRPPLKVSYSIGNIFLGELSSFAANNYLDCTRDITVGNYSILAGKGGQLWTHGYVHDSVGSGRFRVDGEIHIGNNVYIGSMCVINAGVQISDGITIGSNSCVSKSLCEPGLYVSQPLRHISVTPEETKARLNKIVGYELVEEVYEKRIR